MMCSIEELGSTRDFYPEAPEYGIYIFDDSVQVGADAIEVLGLHDSVFEYEITSNRVDCYSVIGIAREAAATFKKPFKAPVTGPVGTDGDVNDYISVEVKDTTYVSVIVQRLLRMLRLHHHLNGCREDFQPVV